jgi:hypothetical protein
MKIANIVSTTKIDITNDINVVKSLDEITQGLPTLIIGWDYVKKNYPSYDIIERKLDKNLYWTFKKTEKRDLHEEDLYNFLQKTYKDLIKDIDYVFIDPIIMKRKVIKKILNKINKTPDIICYQHDNMLYIYGDNIIFGVDLTLTDFIGLDQNKLLTKIKNKSKYFLLKNNIFIEYKNKVENLDNQVKYIPYLYSIENG